MQTRCLRRNFFSEIIGRAPNWCTRNRKTLLLFSSFADRRTEVLMFDSERNSLRWPMTGTSDNDNFLCCSRCEQLNIVLGDVNEMESSGERDSITQNEGGLHFHFQNFIHSLNAVNSLILFDFAFSIPFKSVFAIQPMDRRIALSWQFFTFRSLLINDSELIIHSQNDAEAHGSKQRASQSVSDIGIMWNIFQFRLIFDLSTVAFRMHEFTADSKKKETEKSILTAMVCCRMPLWSKFIVAG